MADKKITVVTDAPFLRDMKGDDAMLVSPPDIRDQVQKVAIATLPTLYRKALEIITRSKNEKSVLEAMKFIATLSTGGINAKHIDSVAKTLSNEEILRELSGE